MARKCNAQKKAKIAVSRAIRNRKKRERELEKSTRDPSYKPKLKRIRRR